MSSYTYEYGFNDCKAKVANLFSGLGLSKVVLQEKIAKKGEIQEEHVEEATAVEAAPFVLEGTSTEEAIPPTIKEPPQATPLVDEQA